MIAAWVALARADEVPLAVGGADVRILLPDTFVGPPRDEFLAFAEISLQTVAQWYGRFPVPALIINVELTDSPRVSGSTWPGDPPVVELGVGRAVTRETYDADWVLVHELTHTAFPSVNRQHHWIEEGLATYLEPWERVAMGRMSAERAWFEFTRDLPQGQPGPEGRGLDRDGSWASTYWGGAMYWFLVDLEIRRHSAGQVGLPEAVRAIAASGGIGDGTVSRLEDVLAIGDVAVGAPILTKAWRQMRHRRAPVDLGALWRHLGVEKRRDTVVFDESAPGAATRRAMTCPSAPCR